MLAFWLSPLVLVDICPIDSRLSSQTKSQIKSVETSQGPSEQTFFQRNALQPVLPATLLFCFLSLYLFFFFNQNEVQIKMHDAI